MAEIDSKKLACVIARTLDEKLGKEITILNISRLFRNRYRRFNTTSKSIDEQH